MDDKKITGLFFERDEKAIAETDKKYGRYCRHIAENILTNTEDCEETVNDSYQTLWSTIPPKRPDSLKAYLARVVKNTALDRLRREGAKKRGAEQYREVLDELSELADGKSSPDDEVEGRLLTEAIERFLKELDKNKRLIFVRRYWYMMSIREIARLHKMSESNIKVTLMRLRERLREQLKKEGYDI